jgi:Carboxypeptidase regulatory-like domain
VRISRLALASILWQTGVFAAALEVITVDTKNRPVGAVEVRLKQGAGVVFTARTGPDGHVKFPALKPARYALQAVKEGFEPAAKNDLELAADASATVELTLVPVLARKDTIEVSGQATPVDEGSSPAEQPPPQIAKDLPGRPATVADALPLVPGVVRSPGGGLVIAGSGEHRSALIVNSADVTDPATGQFGLTVPIDVVQSLNVYQSPFLAEYGRFTAGLVSVETRRGGDKWKWELNDPFPDFRIRSYHMRGLKDATPRLNLEGPLIPRKLYFSEGVDYEIRKTEVYELPFPYNQKKEQGVNSFAQLDWIVSTRQLFTATFHVAPQRLDFVNMDAFNPQPTTPEASTRNYTGTLADKLSVWGGLLENTFSVTRFDARVWGQGQQDFTITPLGNRGSYFAQQDRQASRTSWASTYSLGARQWLGAHNFKVGSYVARTNDNGQVSDRPIDLLNSAGQLFERISFTAGRPFDMTDAELAFFAQDHWLVSPRLALDLGIRSESQALSESFRLAPRVGVAWTPFPSLGTTLRAGFGLFYDRVPLNVYSFSDYPSQLITLFDAAGQVSGGPWLYTNGLGIVQNRFPFVFREPASGNFSPLAATGSVQLEQPLTQHLKLRIGYRQSQSSGVVIMNHLAPDPLTGTGANLLTGNGQSRYRQLEITARVRLNDKRQLFFSYVHSRARGDLNDFATYLGTFALPLLRNNQFGNLPGDLPNRFLTWGLLQLPWGFRIAPLVEYRNGFAYAVTDAAQNWIGVPYSQRFPDFLSIDARVSKDFKVSPKYTLRFSVSSYNLTDHFNPEAVHANIADPAYGWFFGQRGRHFTADFDVLF